jgi:predicted HicB family RNase H-like nuclease
MEWNIRINPDLHRNIAVYAMEHDKTLNAVVEEAIERMIY